MNRSLPSTLSTAAEKHLGSYALAAAAGIGALTSAQVAHAAIITSLNGGQSITNNGTLYLFGTSGPALTEKLGPNHSGSFKSSLSYARHVGVANLNVLGNKTTYFANNLALNTTVSAKATTFLTSVPPKINEIGYGSDGFNLGNFVGKTGYIGFSFPDPSKSTQTDYGWARITVSSSQATLTLVGAAYDNTGAAIMTGQTVPNAVPEPGSLALMAGGAGCLAAWRLRKAKRKQAADAAVTTLDC